MDAMKVLVEALEGHSDSTERLALASGLQKAVKDNVGISVAVDVRDPGGVTRSQGKAVRIVDNRK